MESSRAIFGTGAAVRGRVYYAGSYFFYSNGRENISGLGVLPVVSLKSGVKVNQIKVISGSRGENWPPHGFREEI